MGTMRGSPRAWLGALVTAVLIGLATPVAATAVVAPAGYDVSYPLCGRALPVGAAFAVVGVNGGLANNANPCLATELAWAAATPGLTGPRQPPVSLYLNTADPGNRVADWPTQAVGNVAGATPYGGCDGSWSPACGYLYGELRGASSYQLAVAANSPVAPASVPWWLDVETVSSWAKPTDQPGWAAANIATIQGFVAGLRVSGAAGPIGFYSTRLQWRQITDLDATTSPSRFPASSPDWVAGLGSLGRAQARCSESFSGAPVKLAQYTTAGLDGDYACPPPAPARLRILSHARRGGTLRVSGTISPSYRGRVAVELTATYRGRPLLRRQSPLAVAGRWRAVLAVPTHGTLLGGVVAAKSSAGGGLLAGAAHARVRLG
jgi:hypothetical protein